MAMVLEAAAIPARDSLATVHGARLSLPKCSGGFRVSFPPKACNARPLHSLRGQPSRAVVCELTPPGTVSTAGDVTDKTWKEVVLQCEVPVLVDFWAPWCGPCRMIAPIMDELAKEYSGRIRCVKLNTDESPNTATEYGIRSIPTVMVFKGGEKKDTIIGAVPKSTLVSTIEKFL